MSDKYDLVIIGAGEAGQAAAYAARDRGARVAIVDRELLGGSCPYWACMPSKALLHAAAIHARAATSPGIALRTFAACSTAKNGPTSFRLGRMTPIVAETASRAKIGVAA